MKKILNIAIAILISLLFVSAGPSTVKIALLKYNGGGDWYANPTSLPNLLKFCNKNIDTKLSTVPETVDVSDKAIFNYPFVHMTGHGNVVFSDSEAENLRTYLIAGGFLHIDDNYGLDKYIRPQMKKVFPELEFIELPFDHKIYHQHYNFKNGLPKVHEHDGKSPKGFGLFWENRLICFYSYESDLGDGWEDYEVHHDKEAVRRKALEMGANIISFVFKQ